MSNDLKVDAERDLRDIGAHKIEVYSLNKVRNMPPCVQEKLVYWDPLF